MVGLVLLGGSAVALWQKFAAVTYVATVQAGQAPDAAVISFHERFGAALNVRVAAVVEVPAFVYAGEARDVTVRVENFGLDSELDDVLLVYYEAPEFTVTIPGVELEPKGAQALAAHAYAPGVWSVKGDAPGSFPIAMSVRLRPRDLTETIARMSQDASRARTVAMLRELPARTWALELDRASEPKVLVVKRRGWREYFDTLVRGAVGVLGIVLMVPAIVKLAREERQ